DRERQRISLGLKQTQTDPWQQVLESYQEGDVVQGKVTKVVTFGPFVEILPGVEGLVHISELAQHHVENPREVVSQGDTVTVRIPASLRRPPTRPSTICSPASRRTARRSATAGAPTRSATAVASARSSLRIPPSWSGSSGSYIREHARSPTPGSRQSMRRSRS